jgi:hypothetical protein
MNEAIATDIFLIGFMVGFIVTVVVTAMILFGLRLIFKKEL